MLVFFYFSSKTVCFVRGHIAKEELQKILIYNGFTRTSKSSNIIKSTRRVKINTHQVTRNFDNQI